MLLASGGLDSTTVAYKLISEEFEVYPVFFDYGQHCVEMEWSRLNEVLPAKTMTPQRINISDVFADSKSRLLKEANLWEDNVKDDDLYVPYRTMLFYALAAARAQTIGIEEVYTGYINSNHAKEIDCTAEYLNGLESLSENVGAVKILSPFRDWSKKEVAQLATDLGVPIGRTYSCQASSDFPCGACPNCVERLNALAAV